MSNAKYLSRTGICTTDLAARPTDPLLSADVLFSIIAAAGYTTVQFGFSTVSDTGFIADGKIEFPDCTDLIADGTTERIRTAAQQHGIEISATNGTFNMAHPDPQVRAEAIRRFDSFLCGIQSPRRVHCLPVQRYALFPPSLDV